MRLGLRVTLLAALTLVSAGGIVSVGFISVWRTRAVLAEERYERVGSDAIIAARQIAVLAASATDAASLARILTDDGERLRMALGAKSLTVFDAAGHALWPSGAVSLTTDASGVLAAHAGMKPAARTLPGAEPGSDVVVYAAAAVRGPAQVVRLVTPIADAIDDVLGRTRSSIIFLGVLDGLVLLGAAAWMLRAAIVRPVRELERAAGRVAAGDLSATPLVRGVGELGRLADAFDGMTRSLRDNRESLIRSEKLAGVGRLAAGVAHEVGNPLAAILGYVEMLLGDSAARPSDQEAASLLPRETSSRPSPLGSAMRHDILTRVRVETQRIHHIIQELLDYSRASREATEPVDLARVLDAAVSLVKAQTRFRDATIDVALPAALGKVRGDTGRLTQVVLNLLVNAADATSGQGTITVRARAVDERVILTVTDDGPGIADDLRAKIFDPFFTTKEPGAGTGLGLSVSLAIVEGMGGTIRLGTPERGALFAVELPVAQVNGSSR